MSRQHGLAEAVDIGQIPRMKRTRLVLDADLLAEAKRLSGEKTASAAVMRALGDFVRRSRARGMLALRGCGLWEGDLAVMRRDHAPEGEGAP